MKVLVTIAIAALLFSCKKEEVPHSLNGSESMKLVYSKVSSWEGKDAPLCEGGYPESGADYYFHLVIPKEEITIKKVSVNGKKYTPEMTRIPGRDKDTLKLQMHFYEHSNCKKEPPVFLFKDVESQSLKVEYSFLSEQEFVFEQRVPVNHKKLH